MANIRTKAAAEHVGLSKSQLEKLRCFGGGPAFFKVGRAVIYATADLDAWLAERRQTSTWTASNDNAPARKAAA